MAELHYGYDECCSSDELDSCASKEHVSDREMLMSVSKLAEECVHGTTSECETLTSHTCSN